MAKGFKCGGGGNERAVWIQAYPTEEALLADVPMSQTIGVVTGTAITRWCIQPTVPGSTEGWIWIKDNSSTWVSNHLQVINGTGNPPTYVPVFPSGCMQYINGAWQNKIAYFYKGGTWVQFSEVLTDVYLSKGGDTCDAVTGGWTKKAWKLDQYSTGVAPTVTNNGASVKVALSSSANYPCGAYMTNQDIDVTEFNSLVINIVSANLSDSDDTPGFCVLESRTSTYPNAIARAALRGASAGELIIDISSLQGSYPVGIVIRSGSVEYDYICLRK